ncbi:MAG: DUF3857 domain-containing protein, partial [Caulobacteraceae bacterium]
MRWLFSGFAAAVAISAPTYAAETLRVAPVPGWVKPVELPKADDSKGGAIQMLLLDRQARLGSQGGAEYYEESAYKILNAQGLQVGGALGLVWDPLTDTIVLHKVEIIRDGKAIDVLADGQPFTVMRRESNMAEAVIDGRLTGMRELHDLRVGDIVHFARSRVSTSKVPGLKAEYWDGVPPGVITNRVYFRVRWPKAEPVRWRASEDLDGVTVKADGEDMELLYDRRDVERAIGPEDAPARYQFLGQFQLSAFKDWRELSSVFAPIYIKAAALPARSPLKSVAEKIRRENASPQA